MSYNGRYGKQNCAKCGAEFDSSPAGSTVNCPNCRGRTNTASQAQASRSGPKRLAKKPRDMRGHLWEHHGFNGMRLNDAEAGEGYDAAHAAAHLNGQQFGGSEHTHG